MNFFFADLHADDTPIAETQRYALRDGLSDLAADQQHVSSYGWWQESFWLLFIFSLR